MHVPSHLIITIHNGVATTSHPRPAAPSQYPPEYSLSFRKLAHSPPHSLTPSPAPRSPSQYPPEYGLSFKELADVFTGPFCARLKLEVEREVRGVARAAVLSTPSAILVAL